MDARRRAAAGLVVFWVLVWAVGWPAAGTALAAEPRIEMAPLETAAPAGAPVIPWVAPGDKGWQSGRPLFELADANAPDISAKGWMAVSTDDILIHVVVHHKGFLASFGGSALWSGDAIQFGIDPLGRGADKPVQLDVQELVERRFGKDPAVVARPGRNGKVSPQAKAAADRLARQIADFRANQDKRNLAIADGNWVAMREEDQDFCVGALKSGGTQVWTYYSGHNNAGERPEVKASEVRDEAAQQTTYDVAIPWSEFGLEPGLSPVMKVSFQINNTNGKPGDQTRLYWGGGVGGRFAPWKFQTLAIGQPPAGTSLATLAIVKSYVSSADDFVEARAATTGAAGHLGLLARVSGEGKSQPVVGGASSVSRWAIRAYPGSFRGSIPFEAALTDASSAHLADVTLRVFSDSSDDWYAFTPANDAGPSVVGMNDWVDKPAGRHGYLQIKGDGLAFEDGTPAKLWGVDFGVAKVTDRKQSSALAAWWEKWGVNAVRNVFLFSGQGWQGLGDKDDTTKLDPKRLDDLDFYCSELRKHGIYYGFSAFWNSPLRPADRDKVLNYDEAQKNAVGLENFAPDIQDLHIAAVVNWLKHKNPYTGLTYAEDAAVSYIEMRNEEDVFWYNVAPAVAACPTYQAKIRRQFCDWLKAKYGSAAALRKAWGDRCWGVLPGCDKDEGLEKGDLHPVFSAWYFSPVGLQDQERHFGARRRLLDSAQFLYEQQSSYYARFAKAIRDTGYRGVLVGSDWQADSGVPQLYNILTDRQVGYIDRHDYFGGMGFGLAASGSQDNTSMLWQPGSGLFSSSFQQVADRPFGLSEWCSNVPNEWRAEAPAILGYYGMGLQGWDVSYESFGEVPRFTSTIQNEAGTVWNADNATQLGLYPAIARSIHRGDVKEGAVIAARRVSMDDLHSGDLNFSDVVAQAAVAKEGAADVKEFRSSVPSAALAAGRVVVEFVDKTTPSLVPDLSRQLAARDIRSNTGQLDWRYPGADGSYFTVNTDGTKALVGFAPDEEFSLGDVGIRVDNKFAVVLVTALQKGKTLADCRSALVTVVARERNTGMVYAENRGVPDIGGPPVILEPVFGSVTFGRKVTRVNVLDQDGRRTDRTLPVEGGEFTIDGTRDKTPYYEVVFE